MNIRRQLTLFISGQTEIIEALREEFNPIQFRLIPAHVTLCREDELEALDTIIKNIKAINLDKPVKITFGDAERFADGKGVLIPAKGENKDFIELRKAVLKGLKEIPGKQQPHITLMHPGNSTCTDTIFNHIKKYKLPTELSFDTISLIEQINGGIWNVIQEFKIIGQA
jgi:2'-5' RNA ligase